MLLHQILKIHQRFSKIHADATDVSFAFTNDSFETRVTAHYSLVILRTCLKALPSDTYPKNVHLAQAELASMIGKLSKKDPVDFSLLRPLRPYREPSYMRAIPRASYRPTIEEMQILRALVDEAPPWSEDTGYAYAVIDCGWEMHPLYYVLSSSVARLYGHTMKELMGQTAQDWIAAQRGVEQPPAAKGFRALIPCYWLQLLPSAEQKGMLWQGCIDRHEEQRDVLSFLHAKITSEGEHAWELQIHDGLHVSARESWRDLRERLDMVIREWSRYPAISMTFDAREFLHATATKSEHFVALGVGDVCIRSPEVESTLSMLLSAANGMLQTDLIQLRKELLSQVIRKTLCMDARYQLVTLRQYRRDQEAVISLEYTGKDTPALVLGAISYPPQVILQRSQDERFRAAPPQQTPLARPIAELLYRMHHVTGRRRELCDFLADATFRQYPSPIALFAGPCVFAFGVFWIQVLPATWICWKAEEMQSTFETNSCNRRLGYMAHAVRDSVTMCREYQDIAGRSRVFIRTPKDTFFCDVSDSEVLSMYDWIRGMV